MSYIASINQGATASALATKDKSTDSSKDIMGKQDFLTLLVAQLKNQDPLNPDDPTEFTAQLAQFSSLEQLFNLNESMDNMASSVTSSQQLDALNMIGKEVSYADSEFHFDGKPVQIGYSLDGEAKDVTLSITQNGATIATIQGTELSKGDHYVTWDGLSESGTPYPTGDYTIVVNASAASESIAAAPLVRSEVTGVDLTGDKGGLLITKSGEVNVLDIKGVYEKGTGLTTEDQSETTEEQSEESTVEEAIATTGETTPEEQSGSTEDPAVPTEG
ncbi:MAG: flagellar hook assembly protein FlgD [Desulfobulbaceae bacterium]|nr:MAG: flagellar hook assembly protein FlgD [Desulfobulbaceae bacterium]